MIKYLKSKTKSFITLSTFICFLASSCKEDTNDLGLELLPDSYKFSAYYIDSLNVALVPFSTNFNYASLNNPFIGIADDPVFGRVTAAFASDIYFYLPFDTLTWGKKKILDSIKITLYFDSVVYHNPNPANPLDHSFKISIHNLTTPILKDSNYSISVKPTEFFKGSQLFTLKKIEYPVKNDVSFYLPQSAVEYFQKLFELDSTEITSDSIRHLKGVYGLMFYPQLSNNSIIHRLLTADTITCIEFTYHVEGDWETLYKIKGFFASYVNSTYTNASLSLISWDYSKAKIKTRLNGSDSDSLIYILGESPLRAKLNFSKLNEIAKSNYYNVLKADLYVPFESSYFSSTSSVRTYTNMLKNIDLKIALKADSFASYSSIFGEPLYTTTIDTATKSYVLDVTDYVHKKLNNLSAVDELYFFPSYRYSVQSAFLKNRIKLKIKYLRR